MLFHFQDAVISYSERRSELRDIYLVICILLLFLTGNSIYLASTGKFFANQAKPIHTSAAECMNTF